MAERGIEVDHSTIARWVVHYAPLLNQLIRREMRRPDRRDSPKSDGALGPCRGVPVILIGMTGS